MSKILVTSTQYPYYGGAATNSLAIIKYLRSHGHNVAGIFFENKKVNVDPDKIGGIWRFDPNKSNKNLVRKIVLSYLSGTPSIVLAKNYAAPVYSKTLFPESKIIYLVTGSPQMTELASKNISSIKYLRQKNKPLVFNPEANCIKKVDLVVPNSPQARMMLVKNYGNFKKLYNPIDTSLAFNYNISKGKNFSDRKYDIAFICSNMSRSVKNSGLAKRIFMNFKKEKKIAVGNNSNIFNNCPNTKVINLLPQKNILKILKDTKIVICTSYYDASPNIIKEAILSGCNVLISRNCGWSNLYPRDFVCEDIYNEKEWYTKIKNLLDNSIKHNIIFDNKGLIKDINNLI